jgi:hypothetical protein
MQFLSALVLAISALASPYVVDSTAAVGGVGPFGYTGGYRRTGVIGDTPDMVNTDRIFGGPGWDDIDDRDIQINVGGEDDLLTNPWRHHYRGGCAGVVPVPTWCNRRYPISPYMGGYYGMGAVNNLGLGLGYGGYGLGNPRCV